MDEGKKTASDYLKEPYSRVLIPDDETGTFAAKITEFPGCFAQGDTPEEAYRNLEAAAGSWIEEVLGIGQQVPEPAVNNQYSGRVALRLPKSLHRNAAQLAERDGTSLNQFLVSAIAERVGADSVSERVARTLERWAERTTIKAEAANPAYDVNPHDVLWGWVQVENVAGLKVGANAAISVKPAGAITTQLSRGSPLPDILTIPLPEREGLVEKTHG